MGAIVDRGPGHRPAAFAAAVLGVLVTGLLAAGSAAARGERAFVDRPVPVANGMLFDVGVSDHDRDGSFEVFTTNHKFLATFAERRPTGWVDLMGPSGLSPTAGFPGFENLLLAPKVDVPGLYLYALAKDANTVGGPEKQPRVHLFAHQVSRIPLLEGRARGALSFASPGVRVVKAQGAQVSIRREGDPERTVVRFQIADNAHIVLRVRKIDLPPIGVSLDGPALRARTYVGQGRVPAPGPSFVLRLIDRHGIAWVDANRDGISDAFIVRGGFGGGITRFLGRVSDELLVGDANGRFGPAGDAAIGLVKRDCRARQAAAVDFDGDGRIDLFSSCKGASPMLYRARPKGHRRVGGGFARATGKGASFYRWADVRGGPKPELVVVGKRRARVVSHSRKRGWRVAQRLRTLNGNRLVHAVTVGDFDRDGDTDLFIGSPSGNTLLVNRRGKLRPARPGRLGLPGRGSAVNWVDYDNDGRLDLHQLPAGLFRQTASGRFKATGLARGPKRSLWSVASWADFDGDGDRDLLSATRTQPRTAWVRTRLRENRRARGNWLQVNLRGPAGNPDAIGAKVRLAAGGRRQSGWVGQSEGSRFSQGHYRMYFGLGGAKRVERLVVRWPDGRRSTHRNLATNRVLTLRQP